MRLALAMLVSGALSPALALEGPDREAARAVIERQIEAFRRDDAGAAYGFAAPSIQRMFPSQDVFLDMVRRGYPPVYRPRSYRFGPERDEAGEIELSLQIQDETGTDWDAVYAMERQADGTWRISGCRLVKRPGDAVEWRPGRSRLSG